MATMTNSLPLNERALRTRVSRRLRQRGEILFKSRGSSAKDSLGEYYMVNVSRKEIVGAGLSLVEVAKSLGALREWEELAG